jgi:hypothetical protein
LQLIEKQIRFYEDFIKKLQQEIVLLKRLEEEEGTEMDAAIKAIKSDEDFDKSYLRLLGEIQAETDRKARRNFCIYANQARTNGYGFQAFLVEEELPKLQKRLDDCRRAQAKRLSGINGKPPIGTKWDQQERSWRWKEQAAVVGMSDQFEFIYSFTSRLLHATPVSLTTDQKLLEPHEMHMFLEYIYVSILDIVDMAKKMIGVPAGDAAHANRTI